MAQNCLKINLEQFWKTVLNKEESGQREDNTRSELRIFTRGRKEVWKKGSGSFNYPNGQQFTSIINLSETSFISLSFSEKTKLAKYYEATMRRVRVTIVAVEKQNLLTALSVCL
jgi:hypothetical protein